MNTGTDESERALTWRTLPKESTAWWAQFNNASMGPTPEFGVSEPAPGVVWISVPTFSSGGDAAPKLDALIKEVNKRGEALRRGRAIVIDTRGNTGGNSAWADKLAEAIFTAETIRKHLASTGSSGTDWRASEGNIAHWREFDKTVAREFGTFSTNRLFPQLVASMMQSTLDEGKIFYRQGEDKTGPSGGLTAKRPNTDATPPFAARVYFLSNGSCGSSCLNFADTVLFVPGVKLIGSPTSGDGMLMDVRQELTPSGLARVTFPQKVARGRARGNLEVYAPDIAYDGAWDDASVRAWVMALVAKEAK
jgi:hypothetical protein